jgi:uncharacterized membrane protein YciS (DUF1049 family)
MIRTLRLITRALQVFIYVAIVGVGVWTVATGFPIGWVVIGIGAFSLSLQALSVWGKRRVRRLAAEGADKRAEPGYIAPIIDPEALGHQRRRRLLALSFTYVGTFTLFGIGAIGAAPLLPSELETVATLFAATMIVTAIIFSILLLVSYRKLRQAG